MRWRVQLGINSDYQLGINSFIMLIINLIIHEENTKEITTMSVVLYGIKIMFIYINFSFHFLDLRQRSFKKN